MPACAFEPISSSTAISGRARDGRRFTTENPATGQPITEVAEGGVADVDAAVAAARSAFGRGVWSRMDPGARKRVSQAWADLIEGNARELGLIETIDAGKPITDTVGLDMPETAACIRWHAEAIDKLYGQVAPSPEGTVATITREPVGVVGAVVPWNYPAQMAAWKLGPALATGNSVVIKPASTTSLSLLRIAELGAEAGIPDGVLNVVTGRATRSARRSAATPTSTAWRSPARRRSAGASSPGRPSPNLKRVLLELGGKSPQVVFDDVTDMGPRGATPRSRSSGTWARTAARARGSSSIGRARTTCWRRWRQSSSWPVGDPLDPATKIGALIIAAHLERVLGYVEVGRHEGARLVTGGERILEETGGYFLGPTIFDGVRNDMRIAREEIFGPVLSVIEFDTEAEASRIANDTAYGLAASIYTDDLNVAHRVARELRPGRSPSTRMPRAT